MHVCYSKHFSVQWRCPQRYQEAFMFEFGQTYPEYIAVCELNDEADT